MVLELGLGEGKHVNKCVWEYRATDQWVTLQKKSTVGIRSEQHIQRSGCGLSQEQIIQSKRRNFRVQAKRSMHGRLCEAKSNPNWIVCCSSWACILYSHIACFMSSPSLAWMKCSLYLGRTRARLRKRQSHWHWRQNFAIGTVDERAEHTALYCICYNYTQHNQIHKQATGCTDDKR